MMAQVDERHAARSSRTLALVRCLENETMTRADDFLASIIE